ncbi:unnamed protein product [Phyllotreta striolata]|uniref:SOWAHA-C winged helix-turn-helix domain-containing protein n=1 Tax=Phyllotreta striolata TaxID=444603 RepID=A0A9N9TM25_PHYSR|nr:unnamed protein product [Phyllotreta striolata]
MADNFLTIEQIHLYLLQNGGKVKNRDAVRHFKGYLTDPLTKDENRSRFKSYVNTLALSKTEGDDKIIQLKPKYSGYDPSQRPAEAPINSVGLPPPEAAAPRRTPPRPPPYRPPPPPPPVYSSTTSLDALSLGSVMSLNEPPPQPPPPPGDRRRDSADGGDGNGEDKTVSVKERTQKFNRLASVEDPLSPKQATKSPEKDARRIGRLEPKKCVEWYVTASKGDYQELLKLASSEPRLVNKKVSTRAYVTLYSIFILYPNFESSPLRHAGRGAHRYKKISD